MTSTFSLLILCILAVFTPNSSADDPHLTYYRLYELGRSAYTEERWFECVAFMRRSLEDYKHYRGILWNCNQRCDRHITVDPYYLDTPAFREEKRAIYKRAIPEARIFERFVKRALCIRRCKMDKLPGRPLEYPSVKVEQDFATLKIYSYMQICYWKLADLEHAVSAAYTYLIRNPGDTMMSENLQYYIHEKAYDETTMLKDLEEQEYQTSYLDGSNAYDEQRYMDVIDKMERSLESFFEENAKCRALCELSAPDDGALAPDFYSIITEAYIQVLKCRSSCDSRLTMIKGNQVDDFIGSHFHYLQFAYWKESMVRKAAEAVATFLLFYPEDETMLHNKRYYLSNYDLKPNHFTARPDVVRYYKRLLLEKRLLEFLTEKFRFQDEEYPKAHPEDYRDISDDIPGLDDAEYVDQQERQSLSQEPSDLPEEYLPPGPTVPNRKQDEEVVIPEMELASPFWTPSNEMLNNYESKHGVKVVKRETELNGRYRFLADQLLTKDECRALLELAKMAEPGSGYDGNASPHTKYEDFTGLDVSTVAELASKGKAPLESAKLLLDKSELGRSLVETYFNLTTHLYFDYTHLVCRSAKKDGPEGVLRSDLSHSIHGDNCLLRNGRCDRRSPAYTWRDYSAVIYLNEDFSGGEFIFSDWNKDIQAEVRPSCGQMVGFSGDTLHGVKAVTRGTRCVLALWMTLDPSHEESERIQAQQTLAKIELADGVLPPPIQKPPHSSGEL